MQAQSALAQLYPIGEKGIVVVYLVDELENVGIAFLLNVGWFIGALHKHAHLIDDTVDEGSDTIDERHLGTILKTLTGIGLGVHLAHLALLVDFLYALLRLLTVALLPLLPLSQRKKERFEFVIMPILARQMTKEPQQEEQKDDGGYYHKNHHIESGGGGFQLCCARLEVAVLTGVLLKVEI